MRSATIALALGLVALVAHAQDARAPAAPAARSCEASAAERGLCAAAESLRSALVRYVRVYVRRAGGWLLARATLHAVGGPPSGSLQLTATRGAPCVSTAPTRVSEGAAER
jgi:hypothetical protein